jgi:hypothetical protein
VWRRLTAFGLALAAAVGLLVGVTSAADAAGLSDPAQNVPSSYWPVCSQAGANSQTCTDAVVAAINHARSLEGVGPMVLPTDFASLSPAQQTFVVSNVERVDRGLAPVAGMVDSLNTLAAGAAANDADPMLPTWTIGSFHAVMWGSIWAGDLNPLASDYDWMYNDGWSPSGSINLDCTSASADGCWGHRHVILSAGDHLITGVATVQQSSWMSDAQIFVAGSGTYPAFTYSWADVVGTTPTPDVTQVDPAPVAVPTPVPAPVPTTTTVRPVVVLHGWPTSATTRTVKATLTPALGQTVQLRRERPTGWHTVRRVAAAARMTFANLRPGEYRLVVSAVPGSLRSVVAFTLR